jgi:hypothetical protein
VALRITIQHDLDGLAREIGKLSRQYQDKTIAASMNKAGAKALTTAKREASRILGVKQKDIARGSQGRKMYLFRANPRQLNVEVRAFGRAFNLTRFNAVPAGNGMMATVMGRVRRVPRAFTMNKAGQPVMRRKGRSRFPLEQVWGASAADSFRTKTVQDAVVGRFEKELPVEYARAFARTITMIDRRRRGGRR